MGNEPRGRRSAFQMLATFLRQLRPAAEWPIRAVVDLAAPDACYSCGRPTGDIDENPSTVRLPAPAECLAGEAVAAFLGLISIVNHPFCRRCLTQLETFSRPLRLGTGGAACGAGWVETAAGELFIHRCVEAAGAVPAPPGMDGEPVHVDVCSPFRMNDASLKIIHLIKFSGRRSLVPLAAGAMALALRTQSRTGEDTVLIPVPMHPSAQRRRGFNQAELMASELSRRSRAAGVCRALRKTVRTRRQSTTGHRERAGNVRGVFRWDGEPLRGRHVVLVDDLVTTGATAASCASVCLAAGAGRVTAVSLARAL